MAHQDRLYYFDEIPLNRQEGGGLKGGASFREYVDSKTGEVLPGQNLRLQKLLKEIKTLTEVVGAEKSSKAIINLWYALHPEVEDFRHAKARAAVAEIRAKLQNQAQDLSAAPYATASPPIGAPIGIVPKFVKQVRVMKLDVPQSIRVYADKNFIDPVVLWNSEGNRDPEEGWVDDTPAFRESRKIYTTSKGFKYGDPNERYQYRNKPGGIITAAGMKRGSGVSCSKSSAVAPEKRCRSERATQSESSRSEQATQTDNDYKKHLDHLGRAYYNVLKEKGPKTYMSLMAREKKPKDYAYFLNKKTASTTMMPIIYYANDNNISRDDMYQVFREVERERKNELEKEMYEEGELKEDEEEQSDEER